MLIILLRKCTYLSIRRCELEIPINYKEKTFTGLTNFFNKNYTTNDALDVPYKPYQDMNVNVFYISLNFYILQGSQFYYTSR